MAILQFMCFLMEKDSPFVIVTEARQSPLSSLRAKRGNPKSILLKIKLKSFTFPEAAKNYARCLRTKTKKK
jgi:hypothetical protein